MTRRWPSFCGMTSPESKSRQADKIVAAWKKIMGMKINKERVIQNLEALERWHNRSGPAHGMGPLLTEEYRAVGTQGAAP